jgi:adenosine deaminase
LDTISAENMEQFVAEMPKVELHIHLEGAIPLELLLDFIRREEIESSIQTIDNLRQRFVYTDFPHFLELWNWKNQFLTKEQDFERIAYQVLKKLASQNVKYAEVFYSPGEGWQRGLSVTGITEHIIKGKERACREFGITCRLIVDFVRDFGPEKGRQVLDEVTQYLGDDLIGIGIGGSEADFPAEMFEDLYREAGERGFRLTAHAGEAAGANSIRAAIECLKVDRIGHGTRAYEDPELVSLLKEKRIPLEMCVVSNIKTGVCQSVKSHPIKEYFEDGLLVTVNSDDPVMFHSSVTHEYLTLMRELDFSVNDLKRLSMNGIEASFMSNNDKSRMKSLFESEWRQLQDKYLSSPNTCKK